MTSAADRPRVLIVDDHPANLLAFQSLLEHEYSLALAENGQEALKLALREPFSVILLDVRMPGMDGFEVAELLRKRDLTRHTPIVFMSAYDHSVVQAKKGYVAGATDFIFSPVDEDLLKFKVATYVQISLRNDSVRRQILELQSAMDGLQAELRKGSPSDPVKEKMLALRSRIGELHHDLGAPAS